MRGKNEDESKMFYNVYIEGKNSFKERSQREQAIVKIKYEKCRVSLMEKYSLVECLLT